MKRERVLSVSFPLCDLSDFTGFASPFFDLGGFARAHFTKPCAVHLSREFVILLGDFEHGHLRVGFFHHRCIGTRFLGEVSPAPQAVVFHNGNIG